MSAVLDSIETKNHLNSYFSFFDNKIQEQKVVIPVINDRSALLDSVQFLTKRDNSLTDYLGLILISVVVHTAIINQFNQLSLTEAVVEPEITPPKVMISFSRPQSKPVVVPKVMATPPAPKVVPLKPQPPKRLAAKPIEQPIVSQALPEPIVSALPNPPSAPVQEQESAPSFEGADYLHNPEPEYPELAMNRGWEGRVLMKVHVRPDGKPDEVAVLETSGQRILDDEAVKTVKRWSFVPAKRGAVAVAGWVTVPVTFKLS